MGLDLGLKGKTAIVTGASRGIGREIAQALHGEGVSLVLVARTRGTLEQVVHALESKAPRGSKAAVHPIIADLSLRAEVERVVTESIARLGHVDILVNNAGLTGPSSFFEMSDAEIEHTWLLKGLGYVRLVRALGPHMMERRQGRIVNIVGSTARLPATDFIPGSMVNAALANFTRGVSRELAPHNVRINSISPGWTLTEPLMRSLEMRAAALKASLQEVIDAEARALPLRRLVSMSEIAALTLLLVSDALPAMTGEDVVVDAGAGAALR
jgi:NAD(P)-dependent dehydrogenase (short-subunit alcohol dehydrogenase family)